MRAVLSAYTLSECMDVMAEYAAAYERQGDRNIVFCEDRLTLIAERALTRKTGGTFSSSVTTFARFLQTDANVLSKQGSVMATGSVMAELLREKKLRCFKTTEGIKRGAKNVYETLAQLSASEVSEEVLFEGREQLEEGVLKDKISDLAEIMHGYRAFLSENGYVDESGYLSLLPDCIRKDGRTRGANIFFLCYGSFTRQAAEAIRAACECGKNVVGIFCAGKEELYTNAARDAFLRVIGEYGKTVNRDLGVPIGGEAEILRKSLFDPEALSEEKQAGGVRTDNVRIFEAENKNGEAETVAATVKKLVQTEGLRYRDIAVLTSDATGYGLPFKKAFEEYNIPYFFDVKKSLRLHPLSRFLLDCFAVAREGYSPTSVQALLSNVFFGESDEYRNYLLKFGNYRGGAKKEIKSGELVKGYERDALVKAREKLLSAVAPIEAHSTGRGYCACVRAILEAFQAKRTLAEIEERAEDVATKSYLEQIEGALESVLREAEFLTGDKEMSVAEFEAILSDGLDATEISLIPLKADAVFLGDATDSRIEKVRVLFAVGMTDAVPRNTDDTALVSDKEIEKLAAVKTLIEPSVAEVNLRSRECAALNLCTFTDKLYLSYSLSQSGEEPALSEILRYIGVFKRADGSAIKAEKGLAERDFAYLCSSPTPAVRALLREKQAFESGRSDSNEKYAALFAALQNAGVSECERYANEQAGQVRVDCGGKLFFSADGSISPTGLEEYFRCPFGNFASRGLAAKEREETVTLAVDSGNFVHALLEKTSKALGDLGTEDAVRAFARRTGEELLEKPIYAANGDTPAGKYASESLLGEAIEAAVAVWKQLNGSLFRVEDTEKSVKTPDFRGKIDRVDTTERFVRVIDYKTGAIEDRPVDYYTGRKLQRQLYMSAVKGERIPAGVFYFPASVSYKAQGEKNFRMSGYVNGDRDAVLAGDKNLKEGEESEFFKARLDKNDRIASVMDEKTFSDFLDYAVYEARQGAKELKSGFIAPTPYEGACTYCKYGGMCGFNYEKTPARKESALTPKEIAGIAERHRDGKDESADGEDRGDE